MSYRVEKMGGHVCDLPDPSRFPLDTIIACDECNRRYWRSSTFFRKRPYWSDDWAW